MCIRDSYICFYFLYTWLIWWKYSISGGFSKFITGGRDGILGFWGIVLMSLHSHAMIESKTKWWQVRRPLIRLWVHLCCQCSRAVKMHILLHIVPFDSILAHFRFCFPFHILVKSGVESQWCRITNTYGIHVSILFCLPELKVRINSSEHFLVHKISTKHTLVMSLFNQRTLPFSKRI